mmetsp:Transcript_16907/g.42438  ORF Transcript_16907/g.42438 Transcript_16907/m.42438 type:complete len:213 (+) Transcript_16907:369-1007(+)
MRNSASSPFFVFFLFPFSPPFLKCSFSSALNFPKKDKAHFATFFPPPYCIVERISLADTSHKNLSVLYLSSMRSSMPIPSSSLLTLSIHHSAVCSSSEATSTVSTYHLTALTQSACSKRAFSAASAHVRITRVHSSLSISSILSPPFFLAITLAHIYSQPARAYLHNSWARSCGRILPPALLLSGCLERYAAMRSNSPSYSSSACISSAKTI